ncbi:MAG: flavodoxin family protein [Deltaproteobacteria bacterium]|nr:flavodoxin family protein [Deltaproteobacteria bacterium]
MKLLALNGSPMMKRGMTHLLMEELLAGAREAGAEAETVFLQRKKIAGCLGCYRCWVKTPGMCVQKDDMGELLARTREADCLVLGTPVYLDGMTAQLKLYVDRLIPLLDPHFELVEGHVRHGRRYERLPRVFLVSVAGFPELDNFDGLIDHVERLCRNLHVDFAGSLVRPTSYVLSLEKVLPEPVARIKAAARTAGRELVEAGRVSPETRGAVAEPVFETERFIAQSNRGWDRSIAAGKWPLE